MLHYQERNSAEALAEFESSRRSGGGQRPIGHGRVCAGHRRPRVGSDHRLTPLMDASKQSYVPPYYIALVHLGLGDASETLDWLERAYAHRDVRMVLLALSPK
jgi:hypothetical protein